MAAVGLSEAGTALATGSLGGSFLASEFGGGSGGMNIIEVAMLAGIAYMAYEVLK